MNLVNCADRLDGFKWECRRRINSKRHQVERSVRAGSWFAQSKMTLEEMLEYTYWWWQDFDQAQIRHELGLATHTGVDWDSFRSEGVWSHVYGRRWERRGRRKGRSNWQESVWKAEVPSRTSCGRTVVVRRDREWQLTWDQAQFERFSYILSNGYRWN